MHGSAVVFGSASEPEGPGTPDLVHGHRERLACTQVTPRVLRPSFGSQSDGNMALHIDGMHCVEERKMLSFKPLHSEASWSCMAVRVRYRPASFPVQSYNILVSTPQLTPRTQVVPQQP